MSIDYRPTIVYSSGGGPEFFKGGLGSLQEFSYTDEQQQKINFIHFHGDIIFVLFQIWS